MRNTAPRSRFARMKSVALFLMGMAAAIQAASTVKAAQPVIDRVHADPVGDETRIRIEFNRFMRYVSHSPRNTGKILVIELRPVLSSADDAEAFVVTERANLAGAKSAPLNEIRYEGDHPTGPKLFLSFTRNVTFRIQSEPDMRGINIFVLHPPPREAAPAPLPDVRKAEKEPPETKDKKDAVPVPAITDQRLTRIWEEAEDAMTRRDYGRAVQLYTKLLRGPDHRYTKQALEFLGLARERKGQLAHAKAEYKKYLRLYPKGDDAERVRQRLAGILTARSKPKSKLRSAKRSAEKSEWDTQNYGSISQYFTYRQSVTDTEGRETTQSDLLNDLDFTTRLTSERYDLRALFVGGHAFNFIDEADSNESRVSSLYFDGLDRKTSLSGRIGRQTRNTGGVLGRFDGGLIGYRITPRIKLNGVAGLPVVSSNKADFDNDRYFYGLSMDLGPYEKTWNFSLFAINQDVEGINERRAIGGEARYLKGGVSFFSLIDYDITFNDINIALFNGTATLEDKTTVNLAVDYRKSPILLASNALQGQGVESVASLLNTRSAEEVRDLAADRTATSHSVTLGASRPLNEMYQISGDVTATRLSDTEASGGVEATDGTNYELFYSTQLTGTNLIKQGDVSIVGVRFSDTKSSKTTTVDLNVRYPINRKWRFNPRLRTDYRFDSADNKGNRIRIRPTIRMN